MLVTDPLGRRIGTTPAGVDVNEVDQGVYTGHSDGNQPDLLWFSATTTGTYTVTITGQALRVKLNGVDITGQLALTQTGGWGNWQDVISAAFSANAGTATIRVELLSDMVSLDMIEIVPASGN